MILPCDFSNEQVDPDGGGTHKGPFALFQQVCTYTAANFTINAHFLLEITRSRGNVYILPAFSMENSRKNWPFKVQLDFLLKLVGLLLKMVDFVLKIVKMVKTVKTVKIVKIVKMVHCSG